MKRFIFAALAFNTALASPMVALAQSSETNSKEKCAVIGAVVRNRATKTAASLAEAKAKVATMTVSAEDKEAVDSTLKAMEDLRSNLQSMGDAMAEIFGVPTTEVQRAAVKALDDAPFELIKQEIGKCR